MSPAAPARLSITICWPSTSPRPCDTARAITSTGPPADDGAIIRIGLLGKVSSDVPCPAQTPVAPASTHTMHAAVQSNLILSIPLLTCARGECDYSIALHCLHARGQHGQRTAVKG